MTENNKQNLFVLKCCLADLINNEQAFCFKNALEQLPDIERVDINTGRGVARVISKRLITLADLQPMAEQCGVKLMALDNAVTASSNIPAPVLSGEKKRFVQVQIEGMHCRSCEITIERKFRELPGVDKVDVNADKGLAHIVYFGEAPKVESLQEAVSESGYRVLGFLNNSSRSNKPKRGLSGDIISSERLSFWKLVGLFAVVFIAGSMLSRLGLLNVAVNVGTPTSFGAIFLIGLVAASSSCVVVSGGLLLSSAARFNERYQSVSPIARFRPVLLFVGGRLLSYFVLGGLIGLIGAKSCPIAKSAVKPKPAIPKNKTKK